MTAPAYRLVRRGAPESTGGPPPLDDDQRRVVAHPGGPLLVLAGPGTGKTTTLVEAVVDRVDNRGLDPERVLVLTFSRKAAHEVRGRITARLRRTTREPLAFTFHSYAYALVRREFVLAGDEPPRLLTGPEQLLEIRRLLLGEAHDGARHWPAGLRPALGTRGFAEELRDLQMRATERGLDGRALAALGRGRKRPDWVAAGRFFDRFAARFDIAPTPAYHYAELIHIAAGLLERPDVRARERAAHQAVFVDEYQDTDPAQERLLAALAGDGRDLVVVGDPDQSIYGFRGADVQGILRFADRFRGRDGRPAPVVALGTCRRSGPALLAASRRVAARLPAVAAPGVPAGRHRDLRPRPTDPGEPGPPSAPGSPSASGPPSEPGGRLGGGEVRAVLAESPSQEAAVVADELRRAHLVEGVPWSRMAVLVRSAVRQLPPLRRALVASGVPVVVAGDEMPLVAEPGVRPLILLLRCALHPAELDEAAAAELLCGPLGGADAIGLRRLRRALRHARDRAGASSPPSPVDGVADPGSPLVAALAEPGRLAEVDEGVAAPAARVAALLGTAREAVRAGADAEGVLWAVWRDSGLADRLLAASAAGGPRGAAADRDLDAVVALFESAGTFVDRLPPGAPDLFLDSLSGQEIPADTLAERAPYGEAVRLLTAHRSKGLEWDVVVVAGVQEGIWPDLRLRGSLLGVEDLVAAAGGADPPGSDAGGAAVASKLLDEERRLFYVAVTRARRRLVVTAVGGDDGGPQAGPDGVERPSRFINELLGDPDAVERAADGTRRLALPALVAELRAVLLDTGRPGPLRAAAATRLARLARAGVPGADPAGWYALTPLSDERPVADDGAVVRVSPSQVEQFTKCGLRWLLDAAVGARAADVVRHLGTVIHAVAVLATDGTGDDELGKRLDEIWPELDFGGRWYNAKQREAAGRMVRRFLDWQRDSARQLVAVEEPFSVRLGRVRVTGRVDRLERDERGRAVVVDLKTGGSRPADADLDRHPQLGVYQLAVLLAAFEKYGLVEPGGAELVHVGTAGYTARARIQRQREPAADDDPRWAHELVETVAAGMASGVFEARVNDGCRTCPVTACCPVHENGGTVTP